MNYGFNKNFLSIAFYLLNSASLRLCAFALIFSSLTLAQNTRAHDEEPFCTLGEQQLGNPIKKEDIEKLPLPNDKNDPAKVDISDNSIFDKRCWDGKPLLKKDCSYTSTFAEENSQNPILRQCRLGGFFIACNDSSNEMHACFSYQGEFETLEIAGDFTDWKPVALEVKKEKTGYSAPCFNFSKTARVEYKLIVDGKWITDPANPDKIDNGVGGENSFFTMPDYKPTVWDKSEDDREEFLTMYGFRSEVLNGVRLVSVYVPKECLENICPTLYMQDGGEYVQKTKAVQIQKNLVKAGKVKPFIMVFLNPRDRMNEYFANDDYAKFVAEEVVPSIDKEYKTIKSRDGRAIMGASLGGITSFHTAIKYPEIFSKIGGQSSSFLIDDERVVTELDKLDGKTKFTFYIDDGTLEGAEDSRKVVKLLKDKGFDVTYIEGEAGHNWTAWRDRLADAFMAIWK